MPVALKLQPALDQLPRLIDFIESFADRHALSSGITQSFALAGEELFANTINHSHPKATAVDFSLDLVDNSVLAVYTDDGSEFDPTRQATPDIALAAEQRQIGGLGIHIIRSTMPTFHYQRLGGKNIITFGRPLA